ncbi:hypothetical protein JXB22_10380 [candidate division WOR-3 bacterium]|nr:hypothetical protein [candidate division WOR-3 bacterium]
MKMPHFICARLPLLVLMIGIVGCKRRTARRIDRIGLTVFMADRIIPTENMRR